MPVDPPKTDPNYTKYKLPNGDLLRSNGNDGFYIETAQGHGMGFNLAFVNKVAPYNITDQIREDYVQLAVEGTNGTKSFLHADHITYGEKDEKDWYIATYNHSQIADDGNIREELYTKDQAEADGFEIYTVYEPIEIINHPIIDNNTDDKNKDQDVVSVRISMYDLKNKQCATFILNTVPNTDENNKTFDGRTLKYLHQIEEFDAREMSDTEVSEKRGDVKKLKSVVESNVEKRNGLDTDNPDLLYKKPPFVPSEDKGYIDFKKLNNDLGPIETNPNNMPNGIKPKNQHINLC